MPFFFFLGYSDNLGEIVVPSPDRPDLSPRLFQSWTVIIKQGHSLAVAVEAPGGKPPRGRGGGGERGGRSNYIFSLSPPLQTASGGRRRRRNKGLFWWGNLFSQRTTQTREKKWIHKGGGEKIQLTKKKRRGSLSVMNCCLVKWTWLRRPELDLVQAKLCGFF